MHLAKIAPVHSRAFIASECSTLKGLVLFQWLLLCPAPNSIKRWSDTTFKVKRSRSPGCFAHRRVKAVSVGTYWLSERTMLRSTRRREALRRQLREERGGGISCRHPHSLLLTLLWRWLHLPRLNSGGGGIKVLQGQRHWAQLGRGLMSASVNRFFAWKHLPDYCHISCRESYISWRGTKLVPVQIQPRFLILSVHH